MIGAKADSSVAMKIDRRSVFHLIHCRCGLRITNPVSAQREAILETILVAGRQLSSRTNHSLVKLLQIGFAVKPKVDSRNEGSHNLNNNTNVVQTSPGTRIPLRVTQQRVICSRYAEADKRRRQIYVQDHLITPGCFRVTCAEVPLERVDAQKDQDSWNEVRVYIDGFVVEIAQTLDIETC
jgi:hypothetical protein